jgi:beta-lactamase class A
MRLSPVYENRIKSVFKNKTLVLKACIFLFGFIVGFSLCKFTIDHGYTIKSIRVPDPEYKLISPLVIADVAGPGSGSAKSIEEKLKLKTYDLLNVPGMKNISIYYRDLNSGIWAGVGENMEYNPASLLKVPVLIAWYKQIQEKPELSKKEIYYKGNTANSKDIQFNTLQPNTSYTIEYLLERMIKNSDNVAKDLLLENLDPKTINTVFTDLGIQTWGDKPGSSIHISANTYSRFLRILYNANYLDHEYSQKALELLGSSNFNEGIIAGIPSGIFVSHKFGQFQDESPNIDITELHDCGIVYIPSHPYLLCVMTRATSSTDLGVLELVIKTVSETAYKISTEDIPDLIKNK